MGTFAKRLGQLAAGSLESDSANILKSGAANKKGLSKALDATLRTSHDMRVFGLGTMASMASHKRYARFTSSMHAVYASMETGLDASKPGSPTRLVWDRFGEQLRRADALKADLEEVGAGPCARPSPATVQYVAALEAAAAEDANGESARLLGHFYCRYFADLFGGQALAGPYRWAMRLGPDSPRHYDFGEFGRHRRQSIESIYNALNEAGDMLSAGGQEGVVSEARRAFALNVDVYKEDGRLMSEGALGGARIVAGFVRSRFA